MWEDTRLLLRQTARQAIGEALNRHRPGTRPDIALVGSRRSGSTLLMQVIGRAPGVKFSDQPFAPGTATPAQMRRLGQPPGGLFIAPDAAATARLTACLARMRRGEIHLRGPWRVWSPDFHFRSDRLVLKTTDASYLTGLFDAAGLITILYFRHPVPQALSCQRNGWDDKLALFAAHRPFWETVLDGSQRALLGRMARQEPGLERYVLGWCLENLPLFAALEHGRPALFYEEVVTDPEGTLRRLSALCDIPATARMRRAFRTASSSVRGLSDGAGAAAIRRGDTGALVGRWRAAVDARTLTRIQEILDHFPGCPYRADGIRPRRPDTAPN